MQPGEKIMSIVQLIYGSRPFGFGEAEIGGILGSARKNNERDGITGALVCREDLYLQMLEGPRELVLAAYERILRDDRHTDVVHLWTGAVQARMFPQWAMRHDPAQSCMWTRQQVADGYLKKVSIDELHGLFGRVAQQPPAQA